MTEEFTSAQAITLPDFIRNEQRKHAGATGELSNVLLSIALGTKIVSRGVARAGIASMLGLTGETNVQGEQVQKLDEYADQAFSAILSRSGEFISMVSEERESLFPAKEGGAKSNYVIAFDPLDGSSNIDVNVSIGTIWGVYRRLSDGAKVDPKDTRDFLQPGLAQVAAGYAIYGSSTIFVFSTGQGVNGFTLDPTVGEFILTNPGMKIPQEGSTYSCNEGNFARWSDGVRRYISKLKEPRDEKVKPCSSRYVGSLVADFHRTMLKGGIFLYPADSKNKNGKLRHLYECAPLAFIAEQAQGRASSGLKPILELVPNDIHQRTPFFVGTPKMVRELEEFVQDE